MIAILSFSSLAWFTDNDSATNDFTIGGAGTGDADDIFSMEVWEKGEDGEFLSLNFKIYDSEHNNINFSNDLCLCSKDYDGKLYKLFLEMYELWKQSSKYITAFRIVRFFFFKYCFSEYCATILKRVWKRAKHSNL